MDSSRGRLLVSIHLPSCLTLLFLIVLLFVCYVCRSIFVAVLVFTSAILFASLSNFFLQFNLKAVNIFLSFLLLGNQIKQMRILRKVRSEFVYRVCFCIQPGLDDCSLEEGTHEAWLQREKRAEDGAVYRASIEDHYSNTQRWRVLSEGTERTHREIAPCLQNQRRKSPRS